MSALLKLAEAGQSVWLDFIERKMIESGELGRMIKEEGLKGVTSNPAIFEKALSSSSDYDKFLEHLNKQQVLSSKDLYEHLAIRDIRDAADILFEVYEKTNKRDGYVSLEVSPNLARDSEGTLEEARRLWSRVNRPNLMIKVPGTPECMPAIKKLISEGININITLLFSRDLYKQAAQAYLEGLEIRVKKNLDISSVASVASFFVSRIDAALNSDKIAIANAKLAYQDYKNIISSEKFQTLKNNSAKSQRLLWASTGTKNPKFSKTLYIDSLVGKDTVNTIPPATYKVFKEQNKSVLSDALESNLEQAKQDLVDLVDLKQVTDKLLIDGIKIFEDSFEKMLIAIERKVQKKNSNSKINFKNIWEDKEGLDGLGWLDISLDHPPFFKGGGGDFTSIVLIGMGGSSLAPEIFYKILGDPNKQPKFFVLDSTDSDQIRFLENQLDISNTLFIISSKSGSTLETNLLFEYFFEKSKNSKNFIAITDPQSPLDKLAREKDFLEIFYGLENIGGRYSALSNFGLVPINLLNLNTDLLLKHARDMRQDCKIKDAKLNPGIKLGLSLSNLAKQGCDKITFILSPKLEPFGDWLEQLLAESTGKSNTGLIPIVGESIGDPSVYYQDRVFVYIKLLGEKYSDSKLDSQIEKLERAGFNIIYLEVKNINYIGAECYRWEFAIAIASYDLGVNPFDQPNVEASKKLAQKMLSTPPLLEGGRGDFWQLINSLKPGDYFAIQAFVENNLENKKILNNLRLKIRDSKKVATTLGFGPRFLHSTGQLHKGGPDSGVFLQIINKSKQDLKIPNKNYTFEDIKSAQALGDLKSLEERGSRVLQISWSEVLGLKNQRFEKRIY